MPTKTFYPVAWDSNTVFQNPQNVCAEDGNCMTKGLEGYLLAGNLVITDFGIVEGLPADAEIVSLTLQTKRNLQYTRIPDIYENSAKITMYGEESHSSFFYIYDTPGGDPTLMSPSGWLNVSGTLTATANPEIQGLAKYEAGLSPVTYHIYGRLGGSTPYPETTIAVDFIRLVVEYETAERNSSGKMSAVSGASLGGTRYVFHELDGGSPLLGSLDFDGEIDGGAPSTTAQEFEGEIDGGNPRTILLDFDFIVNLAGEIAGETALSGSATSESENPPVPVPVSGAISASAGLGAGATRIFCLAVVSGGISGATARVTMESFSGGSTGALSSFSGVSAVILLSSGAAEGGSFLGAWIEKGILSKGTASAGTTSSALTERSMAASGTISPSSGGEGRHELTILRRGETGSLSGGDSTATVILRGAGIISSISGKDAVPILVSRGVGRSEAEFFLSGAALVTILGSGEAMMESGGKSLAEVGKHLSGSLGGESEVAARAYSVTETSIRITSSAGVKGRALVERLTKGDSFGTSGAEGNGIIKTPPVLVGRITPDGVLSIKGVLIEGAESIRFTSSGDLHAGSLVEGEEGISIEGTEIRVKALHESAL